MASPAAELDVDGIAVRLSSPDKIYYPQLGEDGGTKVSMGSYYRACLFQSVLELVISRPCAALPSLVGG